MSDCEGRAAPQISDAVLFDDCGKLPSSQDTLLSISNVANMFNVSRLTLRYYERLGLIRRRHRHGQTFVYGWADCDRIAFIIKARKAGLTVRELVPMFKAEDEAASVDCIKEGRAKCLELIGRLDRRRHALRGALAELRCVDGLLSRKLSGSDDSVD